MARIITLKGWGKWSQLLNFLYTDLQDWETIVRDFLTAKGWNVRSVQLTRQSYLNNFLNITVQIIAFDGDSQTRVSNGVTDAIKNLTYEGERKIADARLSVVADTPEGNSISPYNSAPVVNGGSLAVVDVKIPKAPPNIIYIPPTQVTFDDDYKDDSAFELSPTMMIIGGLLLVFLLKE